jgi:hypothetical protein
MTEQFSQEQSLLLKLLALSLKTRKECPDLPKKDFDVTPELWGRLIQVANKHAVLPLLYDTLNSKEMMSLLPNAFRNQLQFVTEQITLQNYKLIYMTSKITKLMQSHKIQIALLKGWHIAALYPTPEYRKSGDIDFIVTNPQEFEHAVEILQSKGFEPNEKQHANHHIAFTGPYNISIELHSMLAEPFDQKEMNQYIEQLLSKLPGHTIQQDILTYKIPVLEAGYDGFYLLLHMLQHYLRAGFGLKLLCDWVVFLRQGMDLKQQEIFLSLITESKISGFAQMMTLLCMKYLGLEHEYAAFLVGKGAAYKGYQDIMKDILDAEEFGHSSVDRMVVLHGTGPIAYFKEFHHQMRLNYPKASRCFLCWPILWMITLFVFLYNNHHIRKTSMRSIFRKADSRGRMIQQMKIFTK